MKILVESSMITDIGIVQWEMRLSLHQVGVPGS